MQANIEKWRNKMRQREKRKEQLEERKRAKQEKLIALEEKKQLRREWLLAQPEVRKHVFNANLGRCTKKLVAIPAKCTIWIVF